MGKKSGNDLYGSEHYEGLDFSTPGIVVRYH